MKYPALSIGRLLGRMSEAVVVAEVETRRIVLWNPSATRIFGYTEAEAVGMRVDDILMLNPPREAHQPGFEHDAATGLGNSIDSDRTELEQTVLRKSGEPLFVELSWTRIDDAADGHHYVMALIRDVAARNQMVHDREGLLRAAQTLAAEGDLGSVLRVLLREAVDQTGAENGMVRRWDPEREELTVVLDTMTRGNVGPRRLGEGVAGRAAATAMPVIDNSYAEQGTPQSHAGTRSVLAVPLLHGGRLLGSLGVGRSQLGQPFTTADAERLQLLASLASAALVGLERSRLSGVLTAALTAQHHLNNQLALTVGYTELLAHDLSLSDAGREMAGLALDGARAAAETINSLESLARQEAAYGELNAALTPSSPPQVGTG